MTQPDRPANEPLAAEINALPDRVRRWIHDLETDADPAGDKWRLLAQEQNIAGLTAEVERLRKALKSVQNLAGGHPIECECRQCEIFELLEPIVGNTSPRSAHEPGGVVSLPASQKRRSGPETVCGSISGTTLTVESVGPVELRSGDAPIPDTAFQNAPSQKSGEQQ